MRTDLESKQASAATWSLASIAFGPFVFVVIHTFFAIVHRNLTLTWAIPLARLYFAGSLASVVCAVMAADKNPESLITRSALFLSVLNLVIAVGEAG